jgi:hypothetical protein
MRKDEKMEDTYMREATRGKAAFNLRILTMVLASFVLVPLATCPQNAVAQQTNTFPTTGNVGVGTMNPTEKLEVNGTVKSAGLTVTGAPTETSYVNGLFLGMSGNTATIDAVDQQDLPGEKLEWRWVSNRPFPK